MYRQKEDAWVAMARDNLEWWMECHQEAIMEKNQILDRLRHIEDKEWRSLLFRWLMIVEQDMEDYRRAIENAESIFRETEKLAESNVYGHGGQGVLV
jgi:hypothetical protein